MRQDGNLVNAAFSTLLRYIFIYIYIYMNINIEPRTRTIMGLIYLRLRFHIHAFGCIYTRQMGKRHNKKVVQQNRILIRVNKKFNVQIRHTYTHEKKVNVGTIKSFFAHKPAPECAPTHFSQINCLDKND